MKLKVYSNTQAILKRKKRLPRKTLLIDFSLMFAADSVNLTASTADQCLHGVCKFAALVSNCQA